MNPNPGYIVVEPIESEEFNKSELATVDDGREHVSTGRVIAVSKFAGVFENYGQQVPSDVEVGNTIAYIQYSEHPVRINSTEYHVVRFDKVIAKIDEVKK